MTTPSRTLLLGRRSARSRFRGALPGLLLPVLLLGLVAAPAEAATASPVIVLLEKGADVDAQASRATKATGKRPRLVFKHALKGYATSLTRSQRAQLLRDDRVKAIVPDTVVRLQAQSTPVGIRRVRATAAPATHINGVDVRTDRVDADIAIIDTGIQPNHPDLNVVGGVNCTGEGSSLAYGDSNGHGTHVAGTAAAIDNGFGVVGTAPGARLWAVRVFRPDGFSRISWIVCGIDWVTSRSDPLDPSRRLIEVANMSLRDEGGDDLACGNNNADPEHLAICASVAAGITYVVAAGNDSGSAAAWRPASYNEVITVSAIADFDGLPGGKAAATCTSFGRRDRDDTFADFSNRGSDVDITAPGVCVRSTYKDSTYATISGTSMASPAVAGAAAVYKALHPNASPSEVRLALRAAGSYEWATGTDPDGAPEPLLDMSSFGANPDFLVTPSISATRIWAGVGSSAIDVRIRRGNGYADSIGLRVDGLPHGVSASWDRDRLGGLGETVARLTLRADDRADPWTGTITITAEAPDRTRTAPVRLTVSVDGTPPVITGPRYGITTGQTIGSDLQVRVSFPTSDAGTGLDSIDALERIDDGGWSEIPLATPSTQVALRRFAFGHDYVHRIVAADRAGNDITKNGPHLRPRAVSERSGTYGGRWGTTIGESAWGGRLRYASTRSASVSYRFTGRAIAWVGWRGPTRGSARVYVDGTYVTQINLRSSTTQGRLVVFARDWAAAGTHTIKVVVLGTGRVDVDGFVVLP
jgi:subtilisin family serine protease